MNKSLSMEAYYDIPLEVTVELGRTSLTISELLSLGQGAILELAKQAGEPLEIRANNRLIAHGEAVVVNDRFGVRLSEVISDSHAVVTDDEGESQ